jgi:hypothetical protein
LKRIFDSVPIPTPMPKQEQQQLTNDSPTAPTDNPFAPPVEELKIYPRGQKIKTIPDATCQTFDPDSGNTTSTSNMNSGILVVNDTSLPIAQ